MTDAAILSVRAVSKSFGGFIALDRVDLNVGQGERLGLIGPNGSGKSTLVNCISGVLRPDGGSIVFAGADITGLLPHLRTRRGIARSFQIPQPFASMTVLENLCIPLEYAADGWRPRLLIADEAMAGLSNAEVDDVLRLLFALAARGISIIMIEHIMRAVMQFSERIVVLDAGRKIADGRPDDVVRDPAVERAYLGE